jgi:hypothetical protein
LNDTPLVEIPEPDIPTDELDKTAEEEAAAAARLAGWKNRRQAKPALGDLSPNLQGSLVLQGLVRMGGDETVFKRYIFSSFSPMLSRLILLYVRLMA